MKTPTRTINWRPFSGKHTTYIKNALDNRMNVAEGAIRAGKTIDHCIIASMYLEVCEDKIHLASGSSLPNAKLNIGDCNGFGLEHLFKGRCHWGKYKSNEALFIQTKTGEKIVIFSGGGKRNSYQKILGNSYGLWIATEIPEHFDSENSAESFIKVAFGRQAAATWPLILWDLNPCHPGHPIYSDYIDKYQKSFVGGYQYQRFTMADNLSISASRRAELESRYIPGTVWHSRDILGERCVAEGLIYRYFAEHKAEFLRTKENLPRITQIIVAGDSGESRSAHSFTATGFTEDRDVMVALCAERHPAKDTDASHVLRLWNAFVARVEAAYGPIDFGYWDSAAQVVKNTLSNKGKVRLKDSLKHPIHDRIDAAMYMIARRKFFYTADCAPLVKALSEAIWDAKHPDRRLDDGTTWIDPLDSWEYSWERYITRYTRL